MAAEPAAPVFEPDAETMPAEPLAALQAERLQGLVSRLLAAGGVQGQRLKEAGISAGADVTLADLARLPVTTKRDLWESYPFGMLAVDRSQVVAVHGSSGTGGKPTLVSYTRGDLKLWARMCARALAAAGATSGSIVHNAYGYGLFTGGIGIHQGAIELGATVVPMSGGMTDRQVTLIRPAARHPHLHPVVRDPDRRGARGGGRDAGPRAEPARGDLRRRAVDRADAGPAERAARAARTGHLRAVGDHRPRRG